MNIQLFCCFGKVIIAVLGRLHKRNWQDGNLFLVLSGFVQLERFLLIGTSSYRIIAVGLRQSQIVAVFGFVIDLVLLTWMPRRPGVSLHKA